MDAGLYEKPPCDLILTKTVDWPEITLGHPSVFTYTVNNISAFEVTDVVIVDDAGTPDYPGDDVVVGTLPGLAGGERRPSSIARSVAMPMCMTVNGTNMVIGTLKSEILPGGDVKVTYLQSRNVVDNTYGTGAVGWPKDHKFGDLTGSDKAQFVFYNADGTKVLDVIVDYLSSSATYPSGYGTLGVSGGEGKVNFGSAANVVSADTTSAGR